MAGTRTPEEIRRSIEANRAELGLAVERLRAEVTEVTDWRKQINKHRKQVLIGAAVGGLRARRRDRRGDRASSSSKPDVRLGEPGRPPVRRRRRRRHRRRPGGACTAAMLRRAGGSGCTR